MIFLIAFTFTLDTLMAQAPPPPNGGLPGINPNGGPIAGPEGAPIGDAILPLMIFVLMYAGKKLYDVHQLQKERT
jgi:hypothetical protein